MSGEVSVIDRCSTVLEEIKQFDEGEEVSIYITLDGLTPKERAQIYRVFEANYDQELQFEKQSSSTSDNKQVVLVVTKIKHKKQPKMKSVQIDDAVVRHFRKYTKLPLPISKHQFIDYYLDCLDPYTGCRAMFSQFLQDEHPSTETFKNTTFGEEMNLRKSSIYKSCSALYIKENQGKQFISVDIRQANYTIVKNYHPEIFRHLPTWEDFVLSFCDEKPIQILKLSKALRERIFGNVNFGKKVTSLAEYFVHKVLHEMNIPSVNLLMLAADEIVLSYDPVTFHRLFDHYNGTSYKVQAFRLIKLPKYDYFVKEYFHPSEEISVAHPEFKCIPLHFIMQCIKQYEGKPILEIDRKFSIERGEVATLDEPIFKSCDFFVSNKKENSQEFNCLLATSRLPFLLIGQYEDRC